MGAGVVTCPHQFSAQLNDRGVDLGCDSVGGNTGVDVSEVLEPNTRPLEGAPPAHRSSSGAENSRTE